MIAKILRSTINACRGFCRAYQLDQSFRLEIWVGLPLLIILIALLWPLTVSEIVFLVLAYGLILVGELLNTSIETLLNRLHPDEHEEIGASKDIAAAAQLVVFILAGIIVLTLLLNNFGKWV